MPWLETPSETFVARHDARDAGDAARVLAQLEHARLRLEERFPRRVGPLAVVLHGTQAQLDMAQPGVVLQRRAAAPAGRRYVVGWAAERELHVLSPRLLAHRASNVEGSLELLMLAPSALLAKRVIAANHPGLPPPLGPRRFRSWLRAAWLVEGSAQFFSGQIRHVRPVIARRLREGPAPAFPPGVRDAMLLGGSVFGLLDEEEGMGACVALARGPHEGGPRRALERAFGGRPFRQTAAAWQRHLARLAGVAPPP